MTIGTRAVEGDEQAVTSRGLMLMLMLRVMMMITALAGWGNTWYSYRGGAGRSGVE